MLMSVRLSNDIKILVVIIQLSEINITELP